MELTVIKEEQQYMEYLEWVDKKFDEHVLPETTELARRFHKELNIPAEGLLS